MSLILVCGIVLFVIVGFTFVASQESSREELSFPLSGEKLQGITWDGKQLWVLDGETKKLSSIELRTGEVIRSLDICFLTCYPY